MEVLKKNTAWILGGLIILFLPAVFRSGFAISLLSQIGIAVIFVTAYNMLMGQTGLISLGHSIYMGLAGYCTMHALNMMTDGSVGYFPVSLLPIFGGLVGLFFGVLIGSVSTVRGHGTFMMISLGFVEVVSTLVIVLESFFHGEEGLSADRWVGPEPFGITFGPAIQVYYLIGAWCLICMIAMYAITKTPFGRICNAVRDNSERADFVGYNHQRVRWIAFSLSSFFSGIAGALYAIHFEHVGQELFDLHHSISLIIMVLIGGKSDFFGPILGAILITFLNAMLADFTPAWNIYLAITFALAVKYTPNGLTGLVMMHKPIWKTDFRSLGQLVRPYLEAFGAMIGALIGILAYF